MHQYRISGLMVASELELLGAIASPHADGESEVAIRSGPVPVKLEEAIAEGVTWQMAEGQFLLRIPDLARFLITGGEAITVELEANATERDASVFILGSAFGILLHQRGGLVLHGAAVARDGEAIVICGRSGDGKSTMAAALCRQGCSFVADDVCAIGTGAGRPPVVLPDGRQLKLWRESIEKLDLAASQGVAVRETFEKYFIQPADIAAAPPRLVAIYVLHDTKTPEQPGIGALALPDAIRMLELETYRPALRAKMGRKREMLVQAAEVLAVARAFRLRRRRGFEHLDETATALLEHWSTLRT